MSYQERRSFVSLISTAAVSVFYFSDVFQRYLAGLPGTADDLSFWAAAIVIFVPVQIVSKIIIHIIFSILNTIATQEDEATIVDELDNLIELKATRNFYHVFMAGFMLSMVTLATGMQPGVMFLVLIFSLIAAAATLDVSQLYFYRWGVRVG